MKGKTYIITGGGSGIGKAIAKKLTSKGANVLISGRNLEKLTVAKMEIQQQEGQVLPFAMDVRDPEMVQVMVQAAKDQFGKIDGLVNNAAGNFICPSEELSINGWKSVIDIALNGTWFCSLAVGKEWIAQGQQGVILNIVATYAWGAGPGTIHSASAKAGVLAMTRTLAVEWGEKYGIRANSIAPGPIENTGGQDHLFATEEAMREMLDSIPLKRLGRVEDIANTAAFLLSPEAEYINGECIVVDGGKWLKKPR
jgi:NAD(P)-dependent dehydrogenase (short-subunit alcohol dehydrogenase family)